MPRAKKKAWSPGNLDRENVSLEYGHDNLGLSGATVSHWGGRGQPVVLFLVPFVLATWHQRTNSLEFKFFLSTNSSVNYVVTILDRDL